MATLVLPLMRQLGLATITLASLAYVVVGVATAALAGAASAPAGVKEWRLAAWALSLAIFLVHIDAVRRQRTGRVNGAFSVALAVAIGALALAVLGPVRSHWADPHRSIWVGLAVIIWPLLTGIPAFGVAMVARYAIDRLGGRTQPSRPGARSRAAKEFE